MAEQIVSPGVFTRESDQSFITEGPIVAGAAIIGPTTKGPIEDPTLVTSYSDYVSKFGGAIQSASGRYDFFTTITAYDYFQQGGDALLVTRVTNGTYNSATGTIGVDTAFGSTGTSFTLETISKGLDQNSSGSAGGDPDANGVLASGSADNVRWQITNVNTGSGTFNLLIRRGNDTAKEPVIVEQYLNVNLDPFSPNYIENVIGNQTKTVKTDDAGVSYLQITGSYPNKSRYVYVSSVENTTPNYLNAAGNISVNSYSSSLPSATSGAFDSATGEIAAGANFYGAINSTNAQGVTYSDYETAVSLLSNKDLYLYGALVFPGLVAATGDDAGVMASAVSNAESAGDSIVVLDPVYYGETSVATVAGKTDGFNTSYAAMYWPWVQTQSPNTGQRVFVPASTFIPGVYAFNDKQRAPWFAPAGLQRGSLGGVIRAEKSLTKSDRDTLYEARVNPIATFSNSGVVVFGQKTLQKKASALDRINVRRLLIALKQFIGGVGRTLVFENNTTATRNAFLAQVNPYLESVQQRQGLYAFKVVMDSSNNTPDIVDRNQLVGQVFIQPAKTAEFVIIDFNILPTGVEFPA